jgi:hypothetical protein
MPRVLMLSFSDNKHTLAVSLSSAGIDSKIVLLLEHHFRIGKPVVASKAVICSLVLLATSTVGAHPI